MVKSMNENSEKILQEETLKKEDVDDFTKTMVCLTCKKCVKTEKGYRCKERDVSVEEDDFCSLW